MFYMQFERLGDNSFGGFSEVSARLSNPSENILIFRTCSISGGYPHIKPRDYTRLCCGRIDPTQAVKATGFNHRGHREHRVVKPILCVPLWLYPLSMLFMSIALLCIQRTITYYARLTQKSCGDGCAAASQTVQSCGPYRKLLEHVRFSDIVSETYISEYANPSQSAHCPCDVLNPLRRFHDRNTSVHPNVSIKEDQTSCDRLNSF